MKCKLSTCNGIAGSSGYCPPHKRHAEPKPLQCERCGSTEGVEQLGGVILDDHCLVMTLIEWRRRKEELFGELQP